jgi:hypothetical protein
MIGVTMSELIHDFFTLTGMVIFFCGVAAACGWHIIKHRWLGGTAEPVNYRTLGIICGVAALVFVGMQNTQLSTDTKRCQTEFADRLRTRAAITDENDALSREHRYWLQKTQQSVGDLIRLAWLPDDPEIAKLDVGDPRRTSYTAALVAQYNLRNQRYMAEIDRVTKRQQQVVDDRAAHPLPPATCGENRS